MHKTQKFTSLKKNYLIRKQNFLRGFTFFLSFIIVFSAMPLPFSLKAEDNSAFSFGKEIIIIDNGFEYKIENKIEKKGGSVEEILENAKVEIKKEDIVFPLKETILKEGMNIIIERAVPVIFNVYGKEKKIFVKKEITVDEAMKKGGIEFKKDDLINADFAAEIFPGMKIKIWQKPKPKPKPSPLPSPVKKIVKTGESQIGGASWYSYRPGNFCASTTFKKGTNLLVTNLENGKSVIVKVNDAGPFVPQRVIDLEKNAFAKLAPLSRGVIKVRVEKLGN